LKIELEMHLNFSFVDEKLKLFWKNLMSLFLDVAI
jgi:hypothetical protein